ncbi:MAG: crosslink repair DNA glycosylase YcaQ family protein [Syntrophobacteraceae bacterium]
MSRLIPSAESLTVEFKSDRLKLPDRDLMETVVGLANTQGGVIYLGVEDNGRVTGLHSDHRNVDSLAAFISNRTSPPVSARVELIEQAGLTVAVIEVPRSFRLTATTDGVLRRRRLKQDGTPETVPFLPHEIPSRLSDLGLLDYSAMPVTAASLDDLDPLERARLRQMIERYGGDRSLLDLDDDAMDGALGLTGREREERRPTVLGLLLIGREAALRAHVPAHEIAFQVLEGEDIRLNEFWRTPLLKTFETIETYFQSQNLEREFQVGLFRVPVPRVDRRAFREAVCNALTHRDYTRRGAVHIRWESDTLTIGNPGGLVEGVTLDNLLTTEPRPRNPALADAFKRVGLVERTGRGVDLIYRGLLRYGRGFPDYGRSDLNNVVVRLSISDADLPFLKLVLDEENARQIRLPIDSLIALSALRRQRRLSRHELAHFIQKDEAKAGQVLEALVEHGLVQPHGVGRGRTYTLSVKAYRTLGQEIEYTRQAGFDALQQEQMVRNLVRQKGEIRRKDVMDLCGLSGSQAYRLLKRLAEQGILAPHDSKKKAFYTPGPNL